MSNVELNDLPIDKANFSVLDFETTGTSARFGKVIEVGIVKVINSKIVDTFQTFINPGYEIPPFITQLTGIKTSDVAGAPYFEDIADSLLNFIGDDIIVAHNLNFDYSFLSKELLAAELQAPINAKLCTLKLARKLLPGIKSKSLGSVVNHFRLFHKNVHRALGDAAVTAKILLKLIEIAKEEHNIETVNELMGLQGIPAKSFRIVKKSLASDISNLPDSPGIYVFKNRHNKIYYVGKGKSLRNRVRNYFSNTAARKAKQIVRKSSRIEFIKTNTELTALLLEAEMIKKYSPEMNSMLKKYSPQHFIKLDIQNEFPIPKATSKFEFDGNNYFGPYSTGDKARTLIEIINKTFLLRECTETEFRKKKKCYLYDIKRCLGPCEFKIHEEYNEELERMNQFLSGKNQYAVDRLLHKMKMFSEMKRFEDAAQARDTINLILNQLNKASILAEPINKARVLIKIKGSFADDYLLMVEGKMMIKNFALDENNLFENCLEDYFNGAVNIFKELTGKDLERIKICLSWLVKNRNGASFYYLKDYESMSELEKRFTGN